MEVLGVAGSVVGIISLGIQISQTLQGQIDEVVHADDRIARIVLEIESTTTALEQLTEIIQEDNTNTDVQILKPKFRNSFARVVRDCDKIFRNITLLVTNSGQGVSKAIDEFQRSKAEEAAGNKEAKPEILLSIPLSSFEHFAWPLKARKLDLLADDLGRQKTSLLLYLGIAALAEAVKSKERISKKNEISWDSETLIDEVYYRNQEQLAAASNFETSIQATRELEQDSREEAHDLIENWPFMPETGHVVTVRDLHNLDVILEGWSCGPAYSGDLWNALYLTARELHETAVKGVNVDNALGSSKCSGVLTQYRKLPAGHQRVIENFCEAIAAERSTVAPSHKKLSFPRLVYLEYKKPILRRFLNRVKALLPMYSSANMPHEFIIITARAPLPKKSRKTLKKTYQDIDPPGSPGVYPRRQIRRVFTNNKAGSGSSGGEENSCLEEDDNLTGENLNNHVQGGTGITVPGMLGNHHPRIRARSPSERPKLLKRRATTFKDGFDTLDRPQSPPHRIDENYNRRRTTWDPHRHQALVQPRLRYRRTRTGTGTFEAEHLNRALIRRNPTQRSNSEYMLQRPPSFERARQDSHRPENYTRMPSTSPEPTGFVDLSQNPSMLEKLAVAEEYLRNWTNALRYYKRGFKMLQERITKREMRGTSRLKPFPQRPKPGANRQSQCRSYSRGRTRKELTSQESVFCRHQTRSPDRLSDTKYSSGAASTSGTRGVENRHPGPQQLDDDSPLSPARSLPAPENHGLASIEAHRDGELTSEQQIVGSDGQGDFNMTIRTSGSQPHPDQDLSEASDRRQIHFYS